MSIRQVARFMGFGIFCWAFIALLVGAWVTWPNVVGPIVAVGALCAVCRLLHLEIASW